MLYDKIQQTVSYIKSRFAKSPQVLLILGTGLSAIGDDFEPELTLAYSEIPNFPESTVRGHRGSLVFGTYKGLQIAIMEGRFHYYEGYELREVTFPIRVMRKLGAEYLFIVSAAGGLNTDHQPGDVMAITDHINLLGSNPLRGITDERLGDRFPSMVNPYDVDLINHAVQIASDCDLHMATGVYAAVSGPSLETDAETKMLKILGADAVGMSTVPEVIVGVQLGYRIFALAAITNVNIPGKTEATTLSDVISCARKAEPKASQLISRMLARISDEQTK